VQLTGRWDELDANGDGIWTMTEVMATRKKLQCKYVVDPLEIFHVFKNMLLERADILWIHPDLKAGKAIHKAYFTYAMGDVAMCGYRNTDMCANLLKRGVFHAALKYGTAPRVGTSIESALDYCREMLAPMGKCEKYLPSTYATWKIESVEQCQKAKYKEFVYKNPGNGVKKSLLEVDYKARQRFANAETVLFQFYKGSICFLWILLLVYQLRGVFNVLTWALEIEIDDTDFGKDSDNGMTRSHKFLMMAVNLLRMVMLLILLYVGLSFLGRSMDYIGLLLDGVALLFIIDVQEIVWEKTIRGEVKDDWGELDCVEVKKIGIPLLTTRPAVEDMFWLLVVLFCSGVFIHWYTVSTVVPLQDSLDCACRSSGAKCFEAERFSQKFWDKYWRYDVPATITEINSLKGGFSVWGHGGRHAHHLRLED